MNKWKIFHILKLLKALCMYMSIQDQTLYLLLECCEDTKIILTLNIRELQGKSRGTFKEIKITCLNIRGLLIWRSLASCTDSCKSISRYIFIVANGAVSWRSVKLTLVVTFIMEAKLVLCFEATSHAIYIIWLKNFISRLWIVESILRPFKIYSDNSVDLFLAKNNKNESWNK